MFFKKLLAIKFVFQTLENKGNADYVQKNGPFLCRRNNVWLGHGYYFWDSFVDNAHWWGIEGARLVNDTKKLMQEKQLYKTMKQQLLE